MGKARKSQSRLHADNEKKSSNDSSHNESIPLDPTKSLIEKFSSYSELKVPYFFIRQFYSK